MSDTLSPPNALESEAAVLAAVVYSRKYLDEVGETLRAEDFFDVRNRWVYEAACQVDAAGEAYDLVTLRERLRQNGRGEEVSAVFLASLDESPIRGNVVEHARKVVETARQREVMGTLQRLHAEGYTSKDSSAYVQRVEERVFDVTSERDLGRPFVPTREAVGAVINQLTERCKPDGNRDFVPTFSRKLNGRIGGYDTGYYHAIAAQPGVGKTSYVLQQTTAVSGTRHGDQRIGSVFFSIEMPRERLLERALCQESGVSGDRMRFGKLGSEHWSAIMGAAERIVQLPIVVDDTPRITVPLMRSKLRRHRSRLHREFGEDVELKFVVVDYLQLVTGTGGNRETEVADVSRGLRELAKEFGVAMLVVSAMNREQARGGQNAGQRVQRRPQMSDLRDSGQIEFDAASVMFLYNETSHLPKHDRSPETTAIFAKHRGGEPIDVLMEFDGAHQVFIDAAEPADAWDTRYDNEREDPYPLAPSARRGADDFETRYP